jgi:TolA-binding protein
MFNPTPDTNLTPGDSTSTSKSSHLNGKGTERFSSADAYLGSDSGSTSNPSVESILHAQPKSIETKEDIEERFRQLELRVNRLERGLHVNTVMTAETGKNTKQILEIFQTVSGGLKILGWLGVVAKWLAAILAAITAVYALIHNPRMH